MPTPEFLSLPWLRLKELGSNRTLNVMLQVSPAYISCFFSYERGDDVEIAVGSEDSKRIKSLLEDALERTLDDVQSSKRMPSGSFTCRFKNLDGGADAEVRIVRMSESIRVVLDRSDEGEFEFLISLEDARRLLDFFGSALDLSTRFPYPFTST